MKKIEVATASTRGTQMPRAANRLVFALVLGSSLASPSWLRSEASFPASTRHFSSDQDRSRGNGRQAAASQSPNDVKDGRGGKRPPAQSRPPKDGKEQPQGKPERPDPRPLPGAPQNGASLPKPGQPANGAARPPRPVRPPNPNAPRPPVRHQHPQYGHGYPHYAWGVGNGWRLHRYFYEDMRRERWTHRHPILVGGYLSPWLVANIRPIPWELMTYLPPVPPGFEAGYFNGYCLVYDQDTFRVIGVIDLYQY
ncbi:MAG: hypothetical protein WBE76_29900 [Terracidiphilus sp.]